MKMRLLHFISAVLLVVILLQPVSAEQYWKEKQQALFDKYDIKDGDVFDSSNCDKIKSLLPEPIFNWVKKGEWTIPIGEMEYDIFKFYIKSLETYEKNLVVCKTN